MHERVIILSRSQYGGNWGAGPTVEAALAKLKEHGGKRREIKRGWRFISELPFAPPDRDATEGEADCWVDRDGTVNWLRCGRTNLTLEEFKEVT